MSAKHFALQIFTARDGSGPRSIGKLAEKTFHCGESSAFKRNTICIARTLLLADGVEKAYVTAARAKVQR